MSSKLRQEILEKMIFNEIDFEVQDEVSSEVMEVSVTISEDMWD